MLALQCVALLVIAYSMACTVLIGAGMHKISTVEVLVWALLGVPLTVVILALLWPFIFIFLLPQFIRKILKGYTE